MPDEASFPIFYSECGGSRLVRNTGTCLQECTVSHLAPCNIVNCMTTSVQLPWRQSVVLCYTSLDLCKFALNTTAVRRSQWPRGLRRRSVAARLLRSWFRIPPAARRFVCCECCVLSGIGLCDELITHPEESYQMWCVVVCDLETSRMRRPWSALGRSATKKKQRQYIFWPVGIQIPKYTVAKRKRPKSENDGLLFPRALLSHIHSSRQKNGFQFPLQRVSHYTVIALRMNHMQGDRRAMPTFYLHSAHVLLDATNILFSEN
jgi:hypothetical protein